MTQPDTPFWLMLAVAATAGLGGGNFASSMANISFFYPDRMKGWALGLNAAGGNIGVSGVQLLAPIVIGLGTTGLYLQNAGLMWLPLIALALYGAVLHMNNLTSARSIVQGSAGRSSPQAHLGDGVPLHRDVRLVHRLLGGVPAAAQDAVPAGHRAIAFLGPLVGSLARPFGGRLADRMGGARVTFWNFIVMAAATVGVLYFIEHQELRGLPRDVPRSCSSPPASATARPTG